MSLFLGEARCSSSTDDGSPCGLAHKKLVMVRLLYEVVGKKKLWVGRRLAGTKRRTSGNFKDKLSNEVRQNRGLAMCWMMPFCPC